jgi:soluble lytic murein transglycosylase
LQIDRLSADLEARLDQAEADEVLAFIDRYAGTAPAERLRRQWLQRLAREQRWSELLGVYVDDGSAQRACWYRRALLATGRADEAFAGLSSLYLTGRSLPGSCDPLFAAWAAAGGLESALVWERVERALARNNAGVAVFQGRYLPESQRPWLDLLVAVHRRPTLLLEQPITAEQVSDSVRRQRILVHGLERLAADSADQAELVWASIAAAEGLPPALAERADAAVGHALARAGDARFLDYLARLEPRADNADLQQARLRVALGLRAWQQLADWSRGLSAGADELGEWRYWRAQALLRVAASPADRAAAAHALASAAEERTLWGFLAAELIGRPPALDHQPVPVDEKALSALLDSEALARIQELDRLGRQADLSREWRDMTQVMDRDQRLVAAAAAARLGLANESILTLARAAYWDDLELRFPRAYDALVEAAALDQGLPPDWLYAVIRQESAFDPDIASHAGAIGLMQLMPPTAREVAQKTGRPKPERLDLIDPALNVALGSAYLAQMQRRFRGHPMVASAAYNAGPTAVSRWLPEQPMPGDLWLTEIPYAETRQYVRRVLTYRVIYRDLLGLPPLRVSALVRSVP